MQFAALTTTLALSFAMAALASPIPKAPKAAASEPSNTNTVGNNNFDAGSGSVNVLNDVGSDILNGALNGLLSTTKIGPLKRTSTANNVGNNNYTGGQHSVNIANDVGSDILNGALNGVLSTVSGSPPKSTEPKSTPKTSPPKTTPKTTPKTLPPKTTPKTTPKSSPKTEPSSSSSNSNIVGNNNFDGGDGSINIGNDVLSDIGNGSGNGALSSIGGSGNGTEIAGVLTGAVHGLTGGH